jgi:membrane associated rhomboid family serine protease
MVLPLRDDNPTRRMPVVTIALIVVNLFVYFAIQVPKDNTSSDRIVNASENDEFTYSHAAIPCEISDGHPLSISQLELGACDVPGANGREAFPDKNVYLAILWSMFMHGGLLHLLGNMLFLWIFGNNVEDRLGRVLYLPFYLAAGLVAALAHTVLNLNSVVPVVGASGAIAGVMGAYLIWFPRARVLSVVVVVLIELPAAVVLGFWFALQFFTSSDSGIAWIAHVGGFAFGVAVALLYNAIRGKPQLSPNY